MARYCFYCGRALSPGEKCTCREDSKNKSTDTADGNSQQNKRAAKSSSSSSFSGQPAADINYKSKQTSWTDRLRQNQQKRQSAKADTNARPKTRPTFHKPDKMAVFAALQQLIRYFIKPADTIRQAVQYSDRRKAFILIGVESLAGGLLMTVLSLQNEIGALFQLTIVQTGMRISFMNRLFLFAQGASVVLSLHLILAALLYLAMRISIRQPVDFVRLISAISPVSFYSTLFLIMAAMAVRGSLFYAIMLLGAGFGMTMLTMFISLRQLGQLDENRAVGLTALLMTAYAAVISLMVSQIAPVLSTLFDLQLAL